MQIHVHSTKKRANMLKYIVMAVDSPSLYLQVACTNWKRIMFVLKQGKPYPDPASIDPSFVHGANKLNLLKHLQTSERKVCLFHVSPGKYVTIISVWNPPTNPSLKKKMQCRCSVCWHFKFLYAILKCLHSLPWKHKMLNISLWLSKCWTDKNHCLVFSCN